MHVFRVSDVLSRPSTVHIWIIEFICHYYLSNFKCRMHRGHSTTTWTNFQGLIIVVILKYTYIIVIICEWRLLWRNWIRCGPMQAGCNFCFTGPKDISVCHDANSTIQFLLRQLCAFLITLYPLIQTIHFPQHMAIRTYMYLVINDVHLWNINPINCICFVMDILINWKLKNALLPYYLYYIFMCFR